MSSNFLRNLVGPQVDENGNPVDDNGNPISVNPPADQADPQSETNPSFTGPNLGDPNLRNILDTDNPTPLGGPESDATSEETARELTPEPAPKIEPPDDTRKKALQQRIDDILNTPKSPWLQQNQGRYQELASLQGLLHEEDASSNQDYQRKLQEQTMYGKNMTNQQRVDAQRYGYDQRLAGLLGQQTLRNQGWLDNTGAKGQNALDLQGAKGDNAVTLQGMKGTTALGVAGINAGARVTTTGMNNDTALGIQAMPRRSASSGADGSAIPKLPADTQKRINSIVTDATLSDQDKGNQLNQVLSPLGLAWSGRDKTIVRKPSFMGGTKGTVPAMNAPPPARNDAVAGAPQGGDTEDDTPPEMGGAQASGPKEGDIQKKGTAMRIFRGGTWQPYVG
jgi:hypothetical protein